MLKEFNNFSLEWKKVYNLVLSEKIELETLADLLVSITTLKSKKKKKFS